MRGTHSHSHSYQHQHPPPPAQQQQTHHYTPRPYSHDSYYPPTHSASSRPSHRQEHNVTRTRDPYTQQRTPLPSPPPPPMAPPPAALRSSGHFTQEYTSRSSHSDYPTAATHRPYSPPHQHHSQPSQSPHSLSRRHSPPLDRGLEHRPSPPTRSHRDIDRYRHEMEHPQPKDPYYSGPIPRGPPLLRDPTERQIPFPSSTQREPALPPERPRSYPRSSREGPYYERTSDFNPIGPDRTDRELSRRQDFQQQLQRPELGREPFRNSPQEEYYERKLEDHRFGIPQPLPRGEPRTSEHSRREPTPLPRSDSSSERANSWGHSRETTGDRSRNRAHMKPPPSYSPRDVRDLHYSARDQTISKEGLPKRESIMEFHRNDLVSSVSKHEEKYRDYVDSYTPKHDRKQKSRDREDEERQRKRHRRESSKERVSRDKEIEDKKPNGDHNLFPKDEIKKQCSECGEENDESYFRNCAKCKNPLCNNCSLQCKAHHEVSFICSDCVKFCAGCSETFCDECIRTCTNCNEDICITCIADYSDNTDKEKNVCFCPLCFKHGIELNKQDGDPDSKLDKVIPSPSPPHLEEENKNVGKSMPMHLSRDLMEEKSIDVQVEGVQSSERIAQDKGITKDNSHQDNRGRENQLTRPHSAERHPPARNAGRERGGAVRIRPRDPLSETKLELQSEPHLDTQQHSTSKETQTTQLTGTSKWDSWRPSRSSDTPQVIRESKPPAVSPVNVPTEVSTGTEKGFIPLNPPKKRDLAIKPESPSKRRRVTPRKELNPTDVPTPSRNPEESATRDPSQQAAQSASSTSTTDTPKSSEPISTSVLQRKIEVVGRKSRPKEQIHISPHKGSGTAETTKQGQPQDFKSSHNGSPQAEVQVTSGRKRFVRFISDVAPSATGTETGNTKSLSALKEQTLAKLQARRNRFGPVDSAQSDDKTNPEKSQASPSLGRQTQKKFFGADQKRTDSSQSFGRQNLHRQTRGLHDESSQETLRKPFVNRKKRRPGVNR